MAASRIRRKWCTSATTITVKVLKFDRAKERVSLGMRQMAPDPWETVAERYPVNSRVLGRVVNVTDYGAFVELEPGVEGLIHITEMTWSRRMKHPSKVVRPTTRWKPWCSKSTRGTGVFRSASSSLRPIPWTTIDSRYSVGSVVEGRVRNMTDFGAFIEIEEGIDGLVHVSDLSWTKRVKHPSEVLKKGQLVQAVILNIDSPRGTACRWASSSSSRTPGRLLAEPPGGRYRTWRISRLASFGAFVELAEGVEGTLPFFGSAGLSGRRAAEPPWRWARSTISRSSR
jgi:small subunit ribosomal protein S1